MLNATLKSLLAHKLRLTLTALAVVLGVAFVSGTLMFTDTISKSFEDVVTTTAGGIDVKVRNEATFGAQLGADEERRPVPVELLDEVAAVEGVRLAEPEITGYAQLIDAEGQPIGGQGPPTIGATAPAEDGFGGTELRDGRYPERAGEVAIDAYTADTQEVAVGDGITVVTTGAAEQATVVGIVGFGEARNLAGATLTLFDRDTATSLFATDGTYDAIEVLAAEGVARDDLAERIQAAVGDAYEVVTADQLIEEGMAQVNDILGIFSTALLVFAAVSLFVGAFIIFNTFSIIVAQRTRELALLRAVGASRPQILGSMLGEAAVTGLFGSVAGLLLGTGVAVALRALMARLGADLPAEALVFAPRTVLVAVVVGVAVTLLAAVVPALRSTRVPPVAALQAVAAPPPPRGGRWRYVIGALIGGAGVAALVAGLFADAGIAVVGLGAALVFLGVTILSPLVTRPIVRVVGAPIARVLGIRGELARENAMRNPRRTASTAAALMIGLGLVGFVTIFAASIKASTADVLSDLYAAEFQISAGIQTFQGLSPEVAERVAALPEVEIAARQRIGQFRTAGGSASFLLAMDPQEMAGTFEIDMVQGEPTDLTSDGVLVTAAVAQANGWAVGDTIPAEFPMTGPAELEVQGLFTSAGDVSYLVDLETHAEHYRESTDFAILVALADGIGIEQGRAALEEVLAPYPTAQLVDQAGLQERLTSQINQLLGLVYGLLFLSVLIALVGIVNTLALSVFERVHELGLLRAVGMSRSQVRSMVRWESVLIAVLGTVLGLGIGVFFAWILTQALADQGFSRFAVPGGQLLAAVIGAALAGVLAGVMPARRAAKVDVLQAVTVE
jgi:putative ABC transport system permease protein